MESKKIKKISIIFIIIIYITKIDIFVYIKYTPTILTPIVMNVELLLYIEKNGKNIFAINLNDNIRLIFFFRYKTHLFSSRTKNTKQH